MKKKFFKKLSAGFMAMAMAFSLLPSTAFAATSSATVATLTAGVYEGTATCSPDEDEDFDAYEVSVAVTVSDGVITAIDYTTTSKTEDGNDDYIAKAADGTKSKTGVITQIIAANSTEDINVVSGATCTSKAIIAAVDAALASEPTSTEDADPEDPEDDPDDTEEAEYVYVTMNIPYADFYAAELNNPVTVDTVTSATSSKWKSQSGTYYGTDDTGNHIYGVQYPVYILSSDLEGFTKSESLSEAGDYAYTAYDGTPSAYKVASVASDGSISFSAVVADKTAIEPTTSFSTSSNYGDYQLNVSNLSTSGTLVAVIVSCDNGYDYGLRALENIWKSGSQLSWSCGISTTEKHGNTLSYAHYESMMGSSIETVTFITTEGVYVAEIEDAQVSVKYTCSLEVEDADVADGKTTVTVSGLPEDFAAVYSVGDGFEASATEITWTTATPGTYTLTISDSNEKYVDTTATFTLSTNAMPAAYDDEEVSLVVADDYTEDEFSAYLSAISSVSVNGTSYSLSGRDAVTIINSDGSINLDASVTSGMGESATTTAIFAESGVYEIVVSATGYTTNLTFTVVVEKYVYVTMNIPYADFYAAEVENEVDVDTVTSATSNKWKQQNAAWGTGCAYTDGDGTILGIQYPVYVSDLLLKELGDELTENDNYYYTVLDEEPSAYKVLTQDEDGNLCFSEVVATETALTDTTVSISTSSRYGDYELTITGASFEGTLVGVVLSTEEGTSYGLRGLENIWKTGTDLSWSTGYTTTESHGNTLSYAHYESMMGQTITSITYLTTTGIYTLECSVYVPVKYACEVTVADADVDDGKTTVTVSGLPEDFAAEYSVGDGFEASATEITWTTATPGTYTLTISDRTGKYVDTTATFTLSTDVTPATYDEETGALVVDDDATEEALANYISNITSVTVNGTTYSLSGRDAVTIINSDGSINLDAVVTSGMGESATTTAIFAEAGEYTIVVTATGYTENLTFTVVVEEEEADESTEEEPETETEVTPTTTQVETLTSLVEEATALIEEMEALGIDTSVLAAYVAEVQALLANEEATYSEAAELIEALNALVESAKEAIEEEEADTEDSDDEDADTEDSNSSSSTTTTEDSDTSDNSLFGLYLAVACAAALAAFAASRRRKYNR